MYRITLIKDNMFLSTGLTISMPLTVFLLCPSFLHIHMRTCGGMVASTMDKITHLWTIYQGPGTFTLIYIYVGTSQ